MRRNGLVSLLLIILVSVGGLAWTLIADNRPLLGLDLQGGVSVVLEPEGEASDDALDQSIRIIRQRVDGIGVAEPEISRQGGAIVVQLPGIDDRERALELVGQTAELRFRPVLDVLPPGTGELSEEDEADQPVVLAEVDDDGNELYRYQLGPTAVTGDVLRGATAGLYDLGQWQVSVQARGDRIGDFNAIAAECFGSGPTCPTRQLAIVLDQQVVSAPTINAASFDPDAISITGSFTEREAKDLALVLRYGSLPVELVPQQTQTVSATLGEDAMEAGVIAGIIGLAAVTVYMIVYYRLLGVVAILSLLVTGALLWTVVSWLGETQGLALTLAGVTGIILSIGVAVDSNVVFYEQLKEQVASGRSLRSAVDGSFATAFSTIVKADVASLIGAAILYWLTVGPVRGFAFFLGLSTLLDLVSSYFFMRPVTVMLVKSKRLEGRGRAFGMPPVAEPTEEVVPA